MKLIGTGGAAGLVAALVLAGCSGAGHSSAGSAGNQAPVTVNSVLAPGAATQGSVSPATVVPAPAAADNTSGQQLSAVDSDLSGIDAATSQADSDTNAGDSAQAQNDNP